ncbi:YdeI/OmpD-associated family protein [Conexibacter woesei]|uniref:YdeI/OmpD-associated family protein n=1 Tax=Conexibacter woesei TaxID=191495 RepID=UPI0004127F4A|nr:YdeI/OmpD-associated family protein [Conexibacter woesei]
MGAIEIETTLQKKGPAAAVVLDEQQVAAVGEGAKAFPVKATINGFTWAGRVTRMKGEFLLGMSKEIRAGAGAEAGDAVRVRIALDAAPREVEVPEVLMRALAGDGDARAKFDALAFTHRKEFARWIAEARRDDTRDRRIGQTLQMLHEGKTRS